MKAKFCVFGFFNELKYGCNLITKYGSFEVMNVDFLTGDIDCVDNQLNDYTFNLDQLTKGKTFFTKQIKIKVMKEKIFFSLIAIGILAISTIFALLMHKII